MRNRGPRERRRFAPSFASFSGVTAADCRYVALVTLNDPQFVEAARALADRALEIGGDSDESRVAFIAERVLARPLTADETAILKKSLVDLADWYKARPDDAKALITVGDSKPRAADPIQLASWTMLTNELMNLDEALCK